MQNSTRSLQNQVGMGRPLEHVLILCLTHVLYDPLYRDNRGHLSLSCQMQRNHVQILLPELARKVLIEVFETRVFVEVAGACMAPLLASTEKH